MMKLFARCLVLVLPCLAGCEGETAVIEVKFAADGSGTCDVIGIRDVQASEEESKASSALFENAKDARTVDLRIRQTKVKFASLNAFKAADITFALEKQAGKNLLTVRIPAESKSKWVSAFGMPESAFQLLTRLDEDARKERAARPKGDAPGNTEAFQMPKPPNVKFHIDLPGNFEGQDFETVPVGKKTTTSVEKTEHGVTLSLPLAEVYSNQMKEIIWKIRFE